MLLMEMMGKLRRIGYHLASVDAAANDMSNTEAVYQQAIVSNTNKASRVVRLIEQNEMKKRNHLQKARSCQRQGKYEPLDESSPVSPRLKKAR